MNSDDLAYNNLQVDKYTRKNGGAPIKHYIRSYAKTPSSRGGEVLVLIVMDCSVLSRSCRGLLVAVDEVLVPSPSCDWGASS